MRIYQVPVKGVFVTNCYFLIDENNNHGCIIDPGAQGDRLAAIIRQQHWTIEKILLTHGHFDHTGGIAALQREYDIPVYCHENGGQYLLNPMLNLSAPCGQDVTVKNFSIFHDGDILTLTGSACRLQVIYTPGHTRDSVTFYNAAEHVAFVGDIIFKGAAGSTEYPTGNRRDLLQSITQKILQLPDNTILLSGHSKPTTVEAEKIWYQQYMN